MKKYLLLFAAAALLVVGCKKPNPTPEPDPDPVVETVNYVISQVLQISTSNPSGVDIKPYFDWFDSFKLTLTTTDGKPSSIVIDNGSIPHNNYGFTLPTSATDCYYDATKKMICRTSDMTELISYDNGKISIPFSLDGKGVSYKYVLTTK